MLRVFIGDRDKALAAVRQFFSKSGRGTQTVSFDEHALPEVVTPFLEQHDLFDSRTSVKLDGVFANDELKDIVFARLTTLVSLPNLFALVEEKIDADTLESLKESAIPVTRLASEKRKEYNPFSLADSLALRDRKSLWVRYWEALEAGEAPEALAGILFWQLKVMYLVSRGEIAELHPYVVSKTKRALVKYRPEEVHAMLFNLVSLYHESRLGRGELSERLERMILSV